MEKEKRIDRERPNVPTMSVSDPGLRRVAVHADSASVDLTLPATVPVAELIPSIVDTLGGAAPGARYHLARLGASPLPNSTTLTQNGIRDGTALVLSREAPAPPAVRYDDAAEAVSVTLGSRADPGQVTRMAAALAAACFTAVGGLALVRYACGAAQHADITAALAAAAALATLTMAVAILRIRRDPVVGLTLSLIATTCAAVAGLLAVPGLPGAPNVLLAAMAVGVTAVLAIRVTHCGVVTLAATACCASITAVAALASTITGAPPHVVGSVTAFACLGLIEVAPRLSIHVAGLAPGIDQDDAVTERQLTANTLRADRWLTSLRAGFAAAAAIGAAAAALAAHRAIALAAVTGAPVGLARPDRQGTSLDVRRDRNHHGDSRIRYQRRQPAGAGAVDRGAGSCRSRSRDIPGFRRSCRHPLAGRAPRRPRAGVYRAHRRRPVDVLDMRRVRCRPWPEPATHVSTARMVCPLLVAVLVSQCGTPPAQAVTPPAVDEKWLPAPALPSPAQRTVQREVCAVATTDPDNADAPAQLAGFDLPQIWQLTRGAGQRVAVIDTGVHRHPRLKELIAGGDYVATGDGTQDCDAHGTLVAGIIAATTDPRFTGVAPDVTLISIRQSSSKFAPVANRSGAGVGDVATLARAVRTAADLGSSVINISSVACAPAAQAPDDRALGAALAYAVDVKDAVVVAAAGNTGGVTQCPPQSAGATRDTVAVVVSPAWYDDYVLTVGSVNSQGTPSSFTLAGPWVDVAATGESVTSLDPAGDGIVNRVNGPAPISGTSYAAPVVSGLAALIRARFPALTARQVMQRIEATAHHPSAGWDPFVGNGTVDALAAISTDTPPTITPAPKPLGVPASVTHTAPHSRSRVLTGTAICLVLLLAALATSRRSGPRRDRVTGD